MRLTRRTKGAATRSGVVGGATADMGTDRVGVVGKRTNVAARETTRTKGATRTVGAASTMTRDGMGTIARLEEEATNEAMGSEALGGPRRPGRTATAVGTVTVDADLLLEQALMNLMLGLGAAKNSLLATEV